MTNSAWSRRGLDRHAQFTRCWPQRRRRALRRTNDGLLIFPALFIALLCVQCNVLLTESPWARKADRVKTAERMFETFDVHAMCVVSSAVLSLYASGRSTGVVVHSGADSTFIAPVFEGYALDGRGAYRLDIGGRHLTEHLSRRMHHSGQHHFATTAELQVARDIKEKVCYVCMDVEAEREKAEEKSYELPDGQSQFELRACSCSLRINRHRCIVSQCECACYLCASVLLIKEDRYMVPEALFRPGLIGLSSHGADHLLCWWVSRLDKELHSDMFSNIVLSGGNTLFDGFGERLQKSVQSYLGKDTLVRVVAPADRRYSAWIGGSIMASLSTFKSRWISKAESVSQTDEAAKTHARGIP